MADYHTLVQDPWALDDHIRRQMQALHDDRLPPQRVKRNALYREALLYFIASVVEEDERAAKVASSLVASAHSIFPDSKAESHALNEDTSPWREKPWLS